MLGVTEEHRGATVLQQLRYLIGVKGCVEWDSRSSSANDSQIRRYPARMVRCQDRHASVPLDPTRQPGSNALGHTREFGKSEALGSVLSLDFECDFVGELAGGFLKTLVKSGHGTEVN